MWRNDTKCEYMFPLKNLAHKELTAIWRYLGEMTRVFGKPVLEYILALAEGNIDYLPRLDTPLLIHIIRFLDLEDVSRLACVSKQFQKVGDLCYR